MQSAYLRVFPAFWRRSDIGQGIRSLWCNIIQSFFSRTFLRAEDRVLWVSLSQERHYLLHWSSSLHCFPKSGPGTSTGPLWGPTMWTWKYNSNLVSLLFHVLNIKSAREALAVWKESQVSNCAKIQPWTNTITKEIQGLVVATHEPQILYGGIGTWTASHKQCQSNKGDPNSICRRLQDSPGSDWGCPESDLGPHMNMAQIWLKRLCGKQTSVLVSCVNWGRFQPPHRSDALHVHHHLFTKSVSVVLCYILL